MRSFRHTWRRHTCTVCFAVYTTRETVDMAHSYRIERPDGSLDVFSRDRLYLSVYDALGHRPDAVISSTTLTDTILASIQKRKRLLITRQDLIDITKTVLKHFDRAAFVRYVSLHN